MFKVFKEPEHLSLFAGLQDGFPPRVVSGTAACDRLWPDELMGKDVYCEIVEPELIVYTDYFSDEEGNAVEGVSELLITLKFVEHEGKTKLINRAQFRVGRVC